MDDHDQQFCLRWNNHQSTIISVFGTLKENEALVDCTLAAEGKFLKAHKVVLSACSPYFATLLQEQYDKHPIFILKDVKYQELCAMMDYMYHGEVNISQDQLAALLKAAESLQIKGLSDNRSTGGSTVPKQEHHRASMPPTPKLSGGYTLEQTKRARIALGPGSIDNQEMGSREGSSSPSRRRRKMGRRSIENATTDVHDNANSSQQPPGPNAAVALSGVGAITAAASALAAGTIATSLPAGASLAGTSTSLAAPAVMSGAAISGTTTSTTKKTESLKAASQQSSDAMNTDNVQGSNLANIDAVSEHLHHHSTHHHHAGDIVDKSSNHKQQKQTSKDASGSGGGPSSELVIEPKSEYDDEGNDEAVEDLTLDEEDMAIDDLDQNAGTSQGGEGSSHGYAPWQPDRSQNELLLETQEAQQRDPQDLSITRIAGLTWNEWNARLAMPLVTQLREGVHPLVFPTDLSIDKTVEKSLPSSAGNGLSAALKEITKSERKSPLKQHPLTSSPVSSKELNEQSCSSLVGVEKVEKNASVDGGSSSGGNVCSTLKHLTEEEATVLMLKAAAEKSAAAANNSGNLSDNSYSEDNIGANSSGNGGPGDYHPAFADVGNAAGLCNINILNSISAMNSLISGSGAGSNGGLGLSTSASGLGVIGGSPSGAGHPCPECGRVYKLKSSLRNHQKWECGKEPQFQCPFCVYRAKQKMHIGRHMERMHKEKFFKVEDLKSFATSATHTAGTSGPTGSVSSSGEETTTTTAVNEMHQHFS